MKSLFKITVFNFATGGLAIGLFAGCVGQNDPLANYPALRGQPSAQIYNSDTKDSSDVEVGAKDSKNFFVRSAYPNSAVKITGAHLNDEDKTPLTYDSDSDTYSVTKSGVTVRLTCSTPDTSIQEIASCKGACLQSCSADIGSDCTASEGSLDLVISTESKNANMKSDRDLSYKLDLKGQSKNCTKPATRSKS
jgi:hypothetical protein